MQTFLPYADFGHSAAVLDNPRLGKQRVETLQVMQVLLHLRTAAGNGHESAESPPWLGDVALHLSHQSNLIRKDPQIYGPRFPGVPDDMPYVWPVSAPGRVGAE